MKAVANLGFLFQEIPLLQRYEKAAAAGFRWVEVPFPYSESAEKLKAAADRHGLKHSLINAPAGDWEGGQRGLAALMKLEDFTPTILQAIEYCMKLDCNRLHVMAGIVKTEEIAKCSFLYFQNISKAYEMCGEHGVEMFVEPISKVAIDGYFLNTYDQAEELIKRGLKDFFHAQQIVGSLTKTTRQLGALVRYVQVAQVPSRHEPSFEGEIDYHYVFKMLRDSQLKDCFVGCEYIPSARHDFSWIPKYNLEF